MEGELPAQNTGEGRDDGIYYFAILCLHLPREELETQMTLTVLPGHLVEAAGISMDSTKEYGGLIV